MASIEIGAGTTFNVQIPLPSPITDYENVLISLYTSEKSPVRFSYVERTGLSKLNEGSTPSELICVLTGAQTANMKGELYMVMRVVEEVGADENIGNSVPSLVGVILVPNVLNTAL